MVDNLFKEFDSSIIINAIDNAKNLLFPYFPSVLIVSFALFFGIVLTLRIFNRF